MKSFAARLLSHSINKRAASATYCAGVMSNNLTCASIISIPVDPLTIKLRVPSGLRVETISRSSSPMISMGQPPLLLRLALAISGARCWQDGERRGGIRGRIERRINRDLERVNYSLSRIDHYARGAAQSARGLRLPLFRNRRRADVL